MFQNPPDDIIRSIFAQPRTIAVVGCSPKEFRDSNMIARFLMKRGHTVIPVNPGHREILGLTCYPDLLAIPQKVEMVDIFRRSEFLLPIAGQAVKIAAQIFWTQLGIQDDEVATITLNAGMTVVMNRCPKIEYARLKVQEFKSSKDQR